MLDQLDAFLESGGPLAEDAGAIAEGYGLYPGGGYHIETIRSHIMRATWRGALSLKTLGIAAGLSLINNIVTYGFGSKRNIGIRSEEFVASTLVDFGVNVSLGLITAALVMLGVWAGIPVSAAGVAAFFAGILVSWGWSALDGWLGKMVSGQKIKINQLDQTALG